jgi:hypothetical protein
MSQYMKTLMERMGDIKEGKETIVEETISEGVINRIANAMVYSPRVGTLCEQVGVDQDGLYTALLSPLKVILAEMGFKSTGMSQAKKDVKISAR